MPLPSILTFTGEQHTASALAAYVLAHYHHPDAPERLAQLRILLPNRRAIAELRKALIQQANGAALLLPMVYSVGDLQPHEWLPMQSLPLPEVFGGAERSAWVSELIFGLMQRHVFSVFEGINHSFFNATRYADSFLDLRDDCLRAEVTTDALAQIVPTQYAEHWSEMLKVFYILNQSLDDYLSAQQMIEPITYQHFLIRSIGEAWQTNPPAYPVIAAGSTGSTPITSRLLHFVRGLEFGQVILPGLDRAMTEEAWQKVHVSHPQYHLKQWLQAEGLSRDDVAYVEMGDSYIDKQISSIMLPAEAMDAKSIAHIECLPHITLHACADDIAEVELTALCIRQALQQETTSIIVVSEDDTFITRLQAMLRLWDITLDRAAGTPALDDPAHRLLLITAELLFEPFQSDRLLALLRHPLSFPDLKQEAMLLADWLDLNILRGWHPYNSLSEIASLCHSRGQSGLLDEFAALSLSHHSNLAEYRLLHIRGIELVAGQNTQPMQILTDYGKFCAFLTKQPRMREREYHELLIRYFSTQRLPEAAPLNAFVSVRGALEMRLHQADLVIIPHMNKGIWPRVISPEPWLNQAMRRTLGLNFVERQGALAAHDIWMLLKAPNVILIHSEKTNDMPVQPSRFFERLQWTCPLSPIPQLEAWRQLQCEYLPALQPRKAPSPPLELRPKRLSATAIETLLSNPFKLYVSHICRLHERQALDAPFGDREFGSIVHKVMESTANFYNHSDLQPYLTQLAIAYKKALHGYILPKNAQFHTKRLERALESVMKTESARATLIQDIEAEISYEAPMVMDKGTVNITATIDRIERRNDGCVQLIDYKTGNVPSFKDVSERDRAQLIIAGWLLHATESIPYQRMALEYWQLKGADVLDSVAKRVDKNNSAALDWDAVLLRITTIIAHYCFEESASFAWQNGGGNLLAP